MHFSAAEGVLRSWTLSSMCTSICERCPVEDVQCFNSITEPFLAKHDWEKSQLHKSWLERDLKSRFGTLVRRSSYWAIKPTLMEASFFTYIMKCAKYIFSWRRLEPLSKRGSDVQCFDSIIQNHPQRNMKRKFLTWFLTLPKSTSFIIAGLSKAFKIIVNRNRT